MSEIKEKVKYANAKHLPRAMDLKKWIKCRHMECKKKRESIALLAIYSGAFVLTKIVSKTFIQNK